MSFSVCEGELVLLCGRSGSGKSTLLKLIKREIAPFGERGGEIRLFGRSEEELSERDSVSKIGFVAQSVEAQLVTETVWRELAFGAESLGLPSGEIRRRIAETAMYFGLERLFRRKTATLSGGEKQLLNLASVMVCEPSVLLLDEPTAQLDPIAAKKLISCVLRLNRELGITVLVCEHRVDELFSYADRILCLDKGRIVTDLPPKTAASDASVFFGALPTAAQIFRRLGGSGEAPITTAQCRSFLADKKVTPAFHPDPECTSTPAAAIKNVFFRYGKSDRDILSDLSFSADTGSVTSILGGNGAGKSTLLKIIAGVEKPYSGKLLLGGKNAVKKHALKTVLLPQSPRELFMTSSVYEDLLESACAAGYGKEAGEAAVNKTAGELGITALLHRHPYDLSGGEQQKAALAKLLLLNPDILLLDEPTKGMDYDSKRETIRLIAALKAKGKTVIIATHDTQTAALCSDRCALLFDGSVVCSDAPGEFFTGLAHYTTPEAHIARGIIPGAVTSDDIVNAVRQQ